MGLSTRITQRSEYAMYLRFEIFDHIVLVSNQNLQDWFENTVGYIDHNDPTIRLYNEKEIRIRLFPSNQDLQGCFEITVVGYIDHKDPAIRLLYIYSNK